MIILTRTFDLLDWLLPKSEQFPKPYRQTVTLRMMDSALDFQEALFDAIGQTGKARQRHLQAADVHLNKLRLYLRFAHRWKWINDGQYKHASAMITEIGRMLGGWMKTTSKEQAK